MSAYKKIDKEIFAMLTLSKIKEEERIMVIKMCSAFLICGALSCDGMHDILVDLNKEQKLQYSDLLKQWKIPDVASSITQLKQEKKAKKISILLSSSKDNFLKILDFLDQIANQDASLNDVDMMVLDKLYIQAANNIERYVAVCQSFKKKLPSTDIPKQVDDILKEGKNRKKTNQKID